MLHAVLNTAYVWNYIIVPSAFETIHLIRNYNEDSVYE